MYEYYFTFNSLSSAQYVRFLLKALQILAQITKAPASVSSFGCTHAVKAEQNAYQAVLYVLQQCRMHASRICQRTASGSIEEVLL